MAQEFGKGDLGQDFMIAVQVVGTADLWQALQVDLNASNKLADYARVTSVLNQLYPEDAYPDLSINPSQLRMAFDRLVRRFVSEQYSDLQAQQSAADAEAAHSDMVILNLPKPAEARRYLFPDMP